MTFRPSSRDYPHGLADEDVLTIARDEKRILLVADRDFGELIFHKGLLHTGVIFFRLPGAYLQAKIERLNTVVEEHADELAHGVDRSRDLSERTDRYHERLVYHDPYHL